MDWAFYTGLTDDGTMVSHRLDLSYADIVPDSSRPYLVEVWLAMASPNSIGLSSVEEGERFDAIEQELQIAFEQEHSARYVGLVTQSGRWQFAYYCPREAGSFESTADEVFARSRNYNDYKVFVEEDPQWSHYLDCLYPQQRKHREQIINYKQLEILKQHGGYHTTTIDFRISTPSGSLGKVVEELKSAGFRIKQSAPATVAVVDDVEVIASKNSSCTLSEVNEITWQLLDLCYSIGGRYIGWQLENAPSSRPEVRWLDIAG